MPLLVHCPNNCQIRLPSNRMGKVVRCVDCQTPIRIPEIESPLLRTGNWVECRAKLAIKKTDHSNNAHDIAKQTQLPPHSIASIASNAPETPSDFATALSLDPPPQNARLLRAKPWRIVEPLTRVDPENQLTPIDLELAPAVPPQAHEGSAANLEFNQKKPTTDNARPTDWLSTIRKLLWYETAADTKPPQSVKT